MHSLPLMGESLHVSRRHSRSPGRLPHRDEYRVMKPTQRHHKPKRMTSPSETRPLPFNARRLDKRDYTRCEPLLASFLDIQKGLVLADLDEPEAKGRWKSFVKKWYVF